jgi:hypothetical protein
MVIASERRAGSSPDEILDAVIEILLPEVGRRSISLLYHRAVVEGLR